MRILKERKLYESQREQLQQQSFNMEQASFTTENLKNVMTTVDAMKTANTVMKQQYKKVNLDKIEVKMGNNRHLVIEEGSSRQDTKRRLVKKQSDPLDTNKPLTSAYSIVLV